MFWPALTLFLLALAAGVHVRWRAVCRRQAALARAEHERLRSAHEAGRAEILSRQDALLNSMAEGILLLDQQGIIQLVNPAFSRLFGLGADVRNRTLMEALRAHELADLVTRARGGQPVLGHEFHLQSPHERWLEVNASAVVNGGGKVQGTVLVFHDVTRLKKLESARRDFVANVSHELRTPLSLIKGYVETLLDGASGQPEVAEKFLLTIARNTERLRLLMDDLLAISQLESGGARLQLGPVRLAGLAKKVCEDFQSRANPRQVTLVNAVPDLTVRADPDRLEQVLCNLLDNAIKYGREGGTVTVAARSLPNQEVEVSVSDDGPGIPRDSLERVFERFYRVDKARAREQGGTGLGLAIVKHIILSHSGRIWAESEAGHGATFRFTLSAGWKP